LKRARRPRTKRPSGRFFDVFLLVSKKLFTALRP
jgi:hypothetical protein